MKGPVHLKYVGTRAASRRRPMLYSIDIAVRTRLACDGLPVFALPVTDIPEEVTCGNCKRTVRFKKLKKTR